MNISGIGSYSGSYNSIKINSLFHQNVQRVPEQETQVSRPQADVSGQQALRKQQTFQSQDYAKQYEAGKTYELKGADSDLASLDEQGSVTDSQKSQIMQQYQLFMGETQAQGVSHSLANGQAVRDVENFAF